MTQTLNVQVDADRTLPLVRAISLEVRERTARIEELEARMVRGERGARIESEFSLQKRELRSCERELGRLGYGIDADDPHRIVGRGSSFRIDDTQFLKLASLRN